MLAGFDEPDEGSAQQPEPPQDTTTAERLAADPADPDAAEQPPREGKTAAARSIPDLTAKTVFVVDAHNLIFQVFHAMPEMTGPQGQPVNAVFGFVRDLFLLIDDYAPDFLVCAFDLPGPTFRHEIYEAYKEDREAMPDDLRPQITNIRRMLEAMDVPAVGCPSYEADDVMATLAKQVSEAGGDCVLVTSDKDCRQLIGDHVKLLNLRKGEFFDAEALQQTWRITPAQVVEFQALVGDSIDNVPGVPLIGPKIAGQLLQDFGSLESLFQNLDQVKGAKRQQNLKAHEAQVMISRQLVALVDDLDVQLDWQQAEVGAPHAESLLALCREFGFRGFANRVAAAAAAELVPVDWQADYEIVRQPSELAELAATLAAHDPIGLLPLYGKSQSPEPRPLIGLALAATPGTAWYVPLASHGELAPLQQLLQADQPRKVGTHLKSLVTALRRVGATLDGIEMDVAIASFLADAGARNHSLEDLSQRHLRHKAPSSDELLGSGKQRLSFGDLDLEATAAFANERADICLRLREPLEQALEARELSQLHREIEVPLIRVLGDMEYWGIKVDVARLQTLSHEYGARLDALEREIYELAGREFNISSPKQLSAILFEELDLPVIKKTKTGLSTDIEVLEELALVHPLPAQIISYRQFAKLKNTYVDSLPGLVNPQTGRIHTSFNQTGAATGRLSSNDPNLQNIPVRTQEGREIRSAFQPGQDDWVLLTADYSQIELRVLAHYAEDATLLQAFADGEDIHARVAAEVFGTSLAEVTSEMRRRAKAVNFGVIYGQSAFGLAKALKIEKQEAADFIERYFEKYGSIGEFMDSVLDACCRDGFVSTLLGRRRRIDGVRPANKRGKQKNLAERTAINTVIQGTAADIIKKAMIDVHRELTVAVPSAHMLLQIHDELVFEVPAEQSTHLATVVRTQMQAAMQLKAELTVDVKVGKNWAECEPM